MDLHKSAVFEFVIVLRAVATIGMRVLIEATFDGQEPAVRAIFLPGVHDRRIDLNVRPDLDGSSDLSDHVTSSRVPHEQIMTARSARAALNNVLPREVGLSVAEPLSFTLIHTRATQVTVGERQFIWITL